MKVSGLERKAKTGSNREGQYANLLDGEALRFGVAVRMTATRSFIKLLAVGFLTIACGHGCTNDREVRRVDEMFTALRMKLEAHKKQVGRYPDSLAALTFTNSSVEKNIQIDFQKLSYRRIRWGYLLSYRGDSGYTKSEEFTREE